MANDTARDPRDMTDEEREAFFSNVFRAPRVPPGGGAPLAPPPDVAAGETLPRVQEPGSDTLRNRLETRAKTLTEQLSPPRKTGWGRVGQVLGTVGQDIGVALAPGAMAHIPGTTLNRRLELEEVQKELGEEQQREALRGTESGRLGIEQQRADIEARKAGLPKLLTGAMDVRRPTGGGTQERAYEQPTGLVEWAPEGQLPSTGGAPTGQVQFGGLPTVQTQPAAPPGAAAAPKPTEYEYGAPKTPTATADEDKYLAALNVAAGQRTKAQQDIVDQGAIRFQKQTPIGDEGVRRYQDMAARAVAGTNITAPNFDPKESTASADEKMKNLQTNVTPVKTMQREQAMLQQRDDEKDRRTQVLSIDPNDNQLKLTSRYNAIHTWNDPDPQTVTGAQLAAMRNELPRLNDVQMNFSNYIKSYRDQRKPLEHPDAVKRIMAGVSDEDARAMSYLTLGAFSHAMEQGEVSNSWNKLNDDEAKLVSGYLRSKGSLVAYNYTVSGTARGAASPTVLAIDVATLPTPDVGAKVALPRLQTFQENLDVLANKYPVNLTGIKTPRTYKERIEGTQQLSPGATEYVPKR